LRKAYWDKRMTSLLFQDREMCSKDEERARIVFYDVRSTAAWFLYIGPFEAITCPG